MGLAILGSLFAIVAVAYAQVRSQRLASERSLAVPIRPPVADGMSAGIRGYERNSSKNLNRIYSGPSSTASPLGLLNRAQAQLEEARSAIDAPAVKDDPRLDATRRDLSNVLKSLGQAKNRFAPPALAKAVSYDTAG